MRTKFDFTEEIKMEIVTFKVDMQQQVDNFFGKCFAAVGIPYSPKDRHMDIADVDRHYMNNGCFWCLLDNDNIIGTIAIRILDEVDGGSRIEENVCVA